MTIIYKFEHEKAMKEISNEHYKIYQNYHNGKYKATHKRVKNHEFYLFDKIFIHRDSICIVTGNQECGGKAYVEHCKSFRTSVDRKNKIVFLEKR